MRVVHLLVVIAACGKSSTESAAPPPPVAPAPISIDAATPAPVAVGTFDEHLQAGRKAGAAKDWPTAVRELDAAVMLSPDDARALAELTWAAVFAKQGDHAREIGARAVQAAQQAHKPKLLAMALNNLGLAEQPVDIHAARSLWKASLDLRPSGSVRKSLEAAGDDSTSTPAGDALLVKLGVPRVEDNRKTPERKQDTKLLAALTSAGADWDMGAGHGWMRFDIACSSEGDAKCDATPNPFHITGAKAKAMIAALVASGAKANGTAYKAHVECYDQDEGYPDGLTPADSCDVTTR